jgi:hypothetical protein
MYATLGVVLILAGDFFGAELAVVFVAQKSDHGANLVDRSVKRGCECGE